MVARAVCGKRRVAKAGLTATYFVFCVVSIKSYCDWTLLFWNHVGNNQVAAEYTNNRLPLNFQTKLVVTIITKPMHYTTYDVVVNPT